MIVAVTLATIFVGAEWVAPVVMSIETARKPPRDARLVPVELQDLDYLAGSRKETVILRVRVRDSLE